VIFVGVFRGRGVTVVAELDIDTCPESCQPIVACTFAVLPVANGPHRECV